MKKMGFQFTILLAMIFFQTNSNAQNPEWVSYSANVQGFVTAEEGDFIWIGTDDGLVKYNKITGEKSFFNHTNVGLPAFEILAIAIDKKGNKWIGTYGGGLCKFDGKTCTIYDSSDWEVSDNHVQSVAVGKTGTIYIGLSYGGLVKYDGTNWTVFDKDNSILKENISSMVVDKYSDIWIGMLGEGVAKYDGQTWTLFKTSNSKLPGNYVNALTTDLNGNIYAGIWTENGYHLAEFDGLIWIDYNLESMGLKGIMGLIADHSGNIWFGNSSEGVVKFDGEYGVIYNTLNSNLPDNDVIPLIVDSDGELWIRSLKAGFYKSDGTSWSPVDISNSSLNGGEVNVIEFDESGTAWIGSGGLLISFDGKIWQSYKYPGSEYSLGYITSIFIDSTGIKWLGTSIGLAKFNGQEWTLFDTSNSGLPDNSVTGVTIDKKGMVWASTSNGVVKYDGKTWTVYNSTNSLLPSNWTSSILSDSNGNIWVGTVYAGLAKYNGEFWKVFNTSNSNLKSRWITCLSENSAGKIWIGTYDGGLSSIENNTVTTYEDGVYNVRSIKDEDNGTVWVGTYGSGLAKYDGSGWIYYQSYDSKLPNDFIMAIAIDDQGHKWIGAGSNLAIYREGGVTVKVQEPLIDTQKQFNLFQNYPNPFNPTTTIAFDLKVSGLAEVSVFNLLGSKVATIVNQSLSAGRQEFQFDASSFASGIYFYQVKTGGKTETKKMVLLK